MKTPQRRSTGKVDRLPPPIKSTVEQMLLTGQTYKEIVSYLAKEGEMMSQMAICTYAKKFLATVDMIKIAQQNFSVLMEQMDKYPNLDTSEAMIRLASHHVINALTNLDEEQFAAVPVDKLIMQTNGLIRAAAHKKHVEIQNQEKYETGLDEVKSIIFKAMAKDNPELFTQVNNYLKQKKEEGI